MNAVNLVQCIDDLCLQRRVLRRGGSKRRGQDERGQSMFVVLPLAWNTLLTAILLRARSDAVFLIAPPEQAAGASPAKKLKLGHFCSGAGVNHHRGEGRKPGVWRAGMTVEVTWFLSPGFFRIFPANEGLTRQTSAIKFRPLRTGSRFLLPGRLVPDISNLNAVRPSGLTVTHRSRRSTGFAILDRLEVRSRHSMP